jgi:hypothetical protein
VTIKGSALIDVRIDVTESNALDDLTSVFAIVKQVTTRLQNGTTNGTQADTVWYERYTESTAQTIDLLGSLTSKLTGSTISFVDVAAIVIYNESAAASGVKVTVGDATNPWVGNAQMLGSANDTIIVHPQGIFLWTAPDGCAPTAGTGDSLKMTPSASCTWWIFVLGRSA